MQKWEIKQCVDMLGCAALAVASDPGPAPASAPAAAEQAAVPLLGVVLSYCAAFGVVLLLLAGRIAGRTIAPFEAGAGSVLLLLTFVRTVVWAADGAFLSGPPPRTDLDAGHRPLGLRGPGITVVFDHPPPPPLASAVVPF